MMQSERHASPGTPAPYGRACTNCSRAKCKCIYRRDGPDGGACERCHRLNKDCQPSVPVRKRNVKKAAGSKTAQLEEKLEDLVTLLRAQAAAKAAQSSSTTSVTPQSPGAGIANDAHATESATTSPYASTKGSQGIDDGATAASTVESVSTAEWEALIHIDISDSAAEQNLSFFRSKMLRWFPFIHIPPTTTSYGLRRQRPFLWFCIMSTTAKSLATQFTLCTRLREIVAQKVVMDGERSIDILLGLICYFGWTHIQKVTGKPYHSMWTQIAIALVYDLTLNRAPPGDQGQLCFKTFWAHPRPSYPHERTMEEKRAVLSMYMISSSTCTMLKRVDHMRWNSYMDDCLRALTEESEWEGDNILACQVRCHLVMNQVLAAPWVSVTGSDADVLKVTAPYFVKTLDAQLQEVKRSIPRELENNEAILMYTRVAELTIHENEILRPPAQSESQSLQRVTNLWTCVKAIQGWFEVYFSQSVEVNVGLTFSVFFQLSHCFIVLYRLSTLEDPSWDKSLVRQTVDVVALMDKFATIMEAIPAAAGLQDPPEVIAEQCIFTRASKTMRTMAATWRNDLDGDQSNAAVPDIPLGQVTQPTPFVSNAYGEDFLMNLGNDQWLSDMFVSWDTQP